MRKSQDIVTFSLQLPEEHVRELAARYQYQDDHDAEHVIGPAAKARGAFTKDEFIRLCRWKTPRSQSRARANSEEAIQEITRLALRIGDEELRVRSLTLLSGVEWPTASVILHFAHKDPYPILDYRALEALGVKQPSTYTFDFWWAYVQHCRQLAVRLGVDMRTLDRALWQYSKEKGLTK